MVPVAHARVDKDTVMISPCYASLADATMFRSRRLNKMTCPALLARAEQSVIIWVERHVVSVRLWGDVARVGRASKIEKDVRHHYCDGYGEFCEPSDLMPDLWHI